jgi:2'-hydroxyisoflavone reductase
VRILLLGGTQFLGRATAEALRAAGHAVSVFNRGLSPDGLPAEIERMRGDRDGDLSALRGRHWEACVDFSGYRPAQLRSSAALLQGQVGRYLFASAVSVYGDPATGPVDESFPLLAPMGDEVEQIDNLSYGPLKVACEAVVQDAFGVRSTLLRPQVVVGPQDPLDRYAYWVMRSQMGGPMLAPGDGLDHLQVIDVRDLARFVVTLIEGDIGGVFNLAGPRFSWAEFIRLLAPPQVTWVPASVLLADGLTYNELPLYRQDRGPRGRLMDVDSTRARAAGLRLSDPAETLRVAQAGCGGRQGPLALAREREAALIRHAASQHHREPASPWTTPTIN